MQEAPKLKDNKLLEPLDGEVWKLMYVLALCDVFDLLSEDWRVTPR